MLRTRIADREVRRVDTRLNTELKKAIPRLETNRGRYCPDVAKNFIGEILFAQLWEQYAQKHPEVAALIEQSPLQPLLEARDVPLFAYNPLADVYSPPGFTITRPPKYIALKDSRNRPLRVKRVLFKQFCGIPAGLVISHDAYGMVLGPKAEPSSMMRNAPNLAHTDGILSVIQQGLVVEDYVYNENIEHKDPAETTPRFWREAQGHFPHIMGHELKNAYVELYKEVRAAFKQLTRMYPNESKAGVQLLHLVLEHAGFQPPPLRTMKYCAGR